MKSKQGLDKGSFFGGNKKKNTFASPRIYQS